MSHIPEDLKYTKDSEWIRMDDEFSATCGITDHAQEMLTDIVFVELPEPGMEVARGEQVGVVESVKAVSNVYSPVSGRISDVNRALEGSPELLNGDPYGEGWMFKIEVKAPRELDDLMDAAAYAAHIESEK
ncbi:MAG: glycine cleavage system protein GcvH [Spirochaetes bacterium]|jgi:glycine cleavage system H protein|nr:glycine cleavage system protein GcvH [Spirochaetota bacterium]